jgi:hypothetical protein
MLRKNTLILVGVFALLVTALLLIQRNRELNPALPESDAPTAPPPTFLFDFASESVVGVLVEGQDGQIVELQKAADGTWLLVQPPTLPEGTNQAPITSAIGQIGTVRVLNELANEPGLDVIGLDIPTATITLTLDSGQTTTIQIGSSSPTGNGYYIRVDGAATMLVDKFFFDQLTGFLVTPPIVPTPVLTTTIGISSTLIVPSLDSTTPVP